MFCDELEYFVDFSYFWKNKKNSVFYRDSKKTQKKLRCFRDNKFISINFSMVRFKWLKTRSKVLYTIQENYNKIITNKCPNPNQNMVSGK